MCILRLQSYYSYIFFTNVVVETNETIILLCFRQCQAIWRLGTNIYKHPIPHHIHAVRLYGTNTLN